jgi:hypothetical protein
MAGEEARLLGTGGKQNREDMKKRTDNLYGTLTRPAKLSSLHMLSPVVFIAAF